jgi:hypothetical protein
MALRVEVKPGGEIELFYNHGSNSKVRPVPYTDVKSFLRVFYYLLKKEIEQEKAERFTPALDLECKKLLKIKLTERENDQQRRA